MPLPAFIRRKLYGRTVSEQRTNAEDEAWAAPRGKGASASKGKDGIAREQFAAKRLNGLGFERVQVMETHSGGRISFNPLGRDEQYDRITPGWRYDPGRRDFLRKAAVFGGAAAVIAIGSGSVGNMIGRSQATPGAGINGPTLTAGGDVDAKRIGGMRYGTEFDTVSHAGTSSDPFTGTGITGAIADLPAIGGAVLLAAAYWSITTTARLAIASSRLSGVGWATYIKLANGANTDVLAIGQASTTGLQDIIVEDLEVDGNQTNNTSGKGILINDVLRWRIERVWVKGCALQGIHAVSDNATTMTSRNGWLNRCRVERNAAANPSNPANIWIGQNSPDCSIVDNVLTSWATTDTPSTYISNIQLDDGTTAIALNHLSNSGFLSTNPASSRIENNIIEACRRTGIDISGSGFPVYDVVIVGNRLRNIGTEANNTYDAIRIATFSGTHNSDFVVASNDIAEDQNSVPANKHRYGINMTLTDDSLVVGNRIRDSQTDALNVTATVLNVLFEANDLQNNTAVLAIAAGSTARFLHNIGYNPVGVIASAFHNTNNTVGLLGNTGTIASATVYTCVGVPVDIYLAGGTVTGSTFTKNGQTLPYDATLTVVHLEPGDTFSITFTVIPTTVTVFGE